MLTLHTSIRMEDVERLELMFAIMTPDGWVIPEWLVILRYHVMLRPVTL